MLTVRLDEVRRLRFVDGTPVRAASGVAPLGGGWLVAQDDAVHGAWVRDGRAERLRLLPPVEGHDVFSSAAGTKHLKPDLEAACPVELDDHDGVLLLGSGSSPRRMRGVLVPSGQSQVRSVELSALYARVAEVLGLADDELNLEGAARTGDVLRWFVRGNLRAGVPSASVDVPLHDLMGAVTGRADPASVPVQRPVRYDLGAVDGVGLCITDAVALADGRTLVSAAAEDTPNAVDDGPVVASALALLDGEQVLAVAALPEVDGRVAKVEGLALMAGSTSGDAASDTAGHTAGARLLAVVDDDDPEAASSALVLRVDWR